MKESKVIPVAKTKILVLSDSHGNDQFLHDAVYEHIDADVIVFLGDGERDLSILDEFPNIWRKRIISVCGNCDYASTLPITTFEDIGGYKFYITHGFTQRVKFGYDALAVDAKKSNRQVALFGHTHHPFYEERNGLYLFNPGSINKGEYGIITITSEGIAFQHATL